MLDQPPGAGPNSSRIDPSLLGHVVALLTVVFFLLFFSGWAAYLGVSSIASEDPARCVFIK